MHLFPLSRRGGERLGLGQGLNWAKGWKDSWKRLLFFVCRTPLSSTAQSAIRGSFILLGSFKSASRNLIIRIGGRGTSKLNLAIGLCCFKPSSVSELAPFQSIFT